MGKYIKEHLKMMEEKEFFSDKDKEYFFHVIQFIQHERLIHLIITIISAIFFFAFGALYLLISNLVTGILFGVFVILLICYIQYYCFLENSVQKMYKLYNKTNNTKTNTKENIICGMNLKY